MDMTTESGDTTVLQQLEQRIVALETGNQYDANKDAIERIERDHLLKLREIRTALLLEQSVRDGTITSASQSVNGNQQQSNKVVEDLQKENEMLKNKMIKLEYRIQHLVSNMEVLYNEARRKD